MHHPFYGCFAQQKPEAFVAINDLLNTYNFDIILEIGAHDFGLSTFFALYCYNSKYLQNSEVPDACGYKNSTHHKIPKTFITYDIHMRDEGACHLIKMLGGIFVQKDIFDDLDHLNQIINKCNRALILCDGGNKIKEFNTFAPILKTGDILMAHDYMEDEKFKKETFEKKWNSCEIMYKDIKNSVENNDLHLIYPEVFNPVFWVCSIKG